MAILRPLLQEAASTFRDSVDLMLDAIGHSIPDNFCFPSKHMPEDPPVFVPCREGRSLYSIVKRRSMSKKRAASRLAGVNGGKNVLFYDD